MPNAQARSQLVCFNKDQIASNTVIMAESQPTIVDLQISYMLSFYIIFNISNISAVIYYRS